MQLEAQLARRDAELETYINCADDVLNTGEAQGRKYHRSVDRNPVTSELSNHPLSKDEAIEALKMTSTKNQALQVEIQGLFKRVYFQLSCLCRLVLNHSASSKRLEKRGSEHHVQLWIGISTARIIRMSPLLLRLVPRLCCLWHPVHQPHSHPTDMSTHKPTRKRITALYIPHTIFIIRNRYELWTAKSWR